MPNQRFVKFENVVCLPRASLSAEAQSSVDSVLKHLKGHSRRLQTALSAHGDELRLLERLYYKGKNQHRSAIFWQRAVEMRRFGRRLADMMLAEMVEAFRGSFWGNALLENPKVMKGAWTHVPIAGFASRVHERLSAACQLLEETRLRLSSAYSCFTSAMKTAYFLQLVLTLTAIAARLNALLLEIHPMFEECIETIHTLIHVLDPSTLPRITATTSQPKLDASSTPPFVDTPGGDDDVEDLDSAVTTNPQRNPSGSLVGGLAPREHVTRHFTNLDRPGYRPGDTPSSSSRFGSDSTTAQMPAPTRDVSGRPKSSTSRTAAVAPVKSSIVVAKRKTQTQADSPLPKPAMKKVKKVKADEIDDIFSGI